MRFRKLCLLGGITLFALSTLVGCGSQKGAENAATPAAVEEKKSSQVSEKVNPEE